MNHRRSPVEPAILLLGATLLLMLMTSLAITRLSEQRARSETKEVDSAGRR
jgi:hypothetical protein